MSSKILCLADGSRALDCLEFSGDPAPDSLRHHYVAYRALMRGHDDSATGQRRHEAHRHRDEQEQEPPPPVSSSRAEEPPMAQAEGPVTRDQLPCSAPSRAPML